MNQQWNIANPKWETLEQEHTHAGVNAPVVGVRHAKGKLKNKNQFQMP